MPILRIGILHAEFACGPVAHVEITISSEQAGNIRDELIKAGHKGQIENYAVQSTEAFLSILDDDGEFWVPADREFGT